MFSNNGDNNKTRDKFLVLIEKEIVKIRKTHRRQERDTFHITLVSKRGECSRDGKKFIRCCMKFPFRIEFHMPMLSLSHSVYGPNINSRDSTSFHINLPLK
jgi:hypothetical protein